MNIDILWGLKAIGEDSPDDYISWAESQLIRGDNSENILILAALGLDKMIDAEEVNFYFQRCAREKNHQQPTKQQAIVAYAEHLCRKIIDRHDNARQLVTKLSHIYCWHAPDNPLLGIWDAIDDDLCMQETHASYGTDPALTLKNKDQYLSSVAEQWLQLTTQSVPQDFLASYWCPSCHALIRATWQQKPVSSFHRLIRPFKKDNIISYQPFCCNCQSGDIFSMMSYAGRELWLQK